MNFSAFDGKPIPKLRVEQVLMFFGAFVIYAALWGLWNLRFHYGFIDFLVNETNYCTRYRKVDAKWVEKNENR